MNRKMKVSVNKLDTNRLALAQRIAMHKPPIQAPPVDTALLVKTARRIQRSTDVLRHMPCDPGKN